jgi:hypothetical protein
MLYHNPNSRPWLSVLALTGLAVLIAPVRGSTAQVSTPAGGAAHPTSAPVSSLVTACQPNWLPAFGAQSSTNSVVHALAVFDDGSGPALYAGGTFTTAGGIAVGYIAKWNGSSWAPLASGMDNLVDALAVFDDGSGPALYAGGNFVVAGGVTVNSIARWNGSSWAPLGSGTNHAVYALTVFDDGSGPALFAGGGFTAAGGVAANFIAKWNGSSWSPLGSGITGSGTLMGVRALSVFDDGGGPALYAGGQFSDAGGLAASNIARWNGSSWSALGSGIGGTPPANVRSLAVFDDGGGSALYVGGLFTTAGGNTAIHIARWDGSSWSPLGSGMCCFYAYVYALTVFDDGHGPSLYAGGLFTTADGVSAHYVARWNGSNWSSLGRGLNDEVDAFTVFDDGGGPALYVGGDFLTNAAGDTRLAKWGNPPGCGTPGASICEPGTGGVIACPCANAPAGGGLGCDNSASTGGAQLVATGIARLAFDTVVFTTSGEKPTATSIVLQGDGASSTGVAFGQGVRCVAGHLLRMYVEHAVGGSIRAPQGTGPHVHVRSAALGDAIAPGTRRYYGVYYRDPTVLGGCPGASTFNITQQLDVLWGA